MSVIAENIERLFLEESREKKRIGANIHSRTGTRGYIGKMMFPSDLLRGKEKRQYKQNSKVEVWNMYNEIVSYEAFNALSQDDKKRHLIAYRNKFTNDVIKEKWGLHNASYYKLVKDLELPKAKRTNKQGTGKGTTNKTKSVASTPAPVKEVTNTKPSLIQLVNEMPPVEEIATPAPKTDSINITDLRQAFREFQLTQVKVPQEVPQPLEKVKGMSITCNGEYSATEIIKKLEKIELLLDGENSKFILELNIKEVQN